MSDKELDGSHFQYLPTEYGKPVRFDAKIHCQICDVALVATFTERQSAWAEPYPGHADLLMFKKPANAVNARLI